MKLAPKFYFTQVTLLPRVSEAIQGDMRKIGIDWKMHRLRLDDSPAKMESRTTKSGP